jgi:hypothetical protein
VSNNRIAFAAVVVVVVVEEKLAGVEGVISRLVSNRPLDSLQDLTISLQLGFSASLLL